MKTPLKTVLRNFLNLVEDLETRRILGDDQYELEFQKLKQLTDRLKEDAEYPCSHGQKEVNRPKNRYKDIVPYDFSRVLLPEYSSVPGSDYINASYIKGASGAYAYIAAQGPLPNTSVDFWRMIWATETQVIVMACNEKEAGKYKCESYWPQDGDTRVYGNISVSLVKWTQVCPDFLVRTLLVKQQDDERLICQFHYTTWPDHGVPETVQPILEMVRLVRDCQASETVPILVHCSAGCGRTGTICAIDFIWACLRSGKLSESFCLYDVVAEMRQQRIAMVQTKEQYALIHKAVASMFEQQLRVIDSHTYENLDEDGEPLMWKELQKAESSKESVMNQGHSVAINGKDISSLFGRPNCLKPDIFAKKNLKCADAEGNHTKFKSSKVGRSDLSTVTGLKDVHQFFSNNNTKPKYNTLPAKPVSKNTKASLSSPTDTANVVLSPVVENPSITDDKIQTSKDSALSVVFTGGSDETIPFIDDEEEIKSESSQIRTQGGRAYLNLPRCDSISKIINGFDPFVDKLSLGTDDSSPDSDVSGHIGKLFCSNKPSYEENQVVEDKSPSVDVLGISSCASSDTKASSLKNKDVDKLNFIITKDEPSLAEIPKNITEGSKSKSGGNYNVNKSLNCKATPMKDSNVEKLKLAVNEEIPKNTTDSLQTSNDFKETLSQPSSKVSCTKMLSKSGPADPSVGEQNLLKQVGKAAILRRPSIAKLKALFDRSGSSGEKGKTVSGDESSLKHSAPPMSRAGSAPPSLSCISRNGEEKDSLLSMVTRKFRSSSVKTEHELQKEKKSSTPTVTVPKKSGHSSLSQFRTNVANLTRNMSFSLTKSSKFSSFTQNKWHNVAESNVDKRETNVSETGGKASLNSDKLMSRSYNAQWYDNKALTGNQGVSDQVNSFNNVPLKSSPSSGSRQVVNDLLVKSSADVTPIQSSIALNVKDNSLSDKEKVQPPTYNCLEKKPKISLPFLNSLNKTNPKESSSLWYSSPDSGNQTSKETSETNKNVGESISSNAGTVESVLSTILPDNIHLASNKCDHAPELPQSDSVATIHLAKSKFYAPVNKATDKPPILPQKKRAQNFGYPVPEEIIEISSELIESDKNPMGFWPPSSLAISSENGTVSCDLSCADKGQDEDHDVSSVPDKSIEFTTLGKPKQHKTETVDYKLQPMYSDLKENSAISYKTEGNTVVKDIPPALPKKMVLGKQKTLLPDVLVNTNDVSSVDSNSLNTSDISSKVVSEQISSEGNFSCDTLEPVKANMELKVKGDVYMNVNVVAKKNIEQIENTLRNHPRGAIIDLTSRESYSMEEELALAVSRLCKPPEKLKPCLQKSGDHKFPGYEVIWPESRGSNTMDKYILEQASVTKNSDSVKMKCRMEFPKSFTKTNGLLSQVGNKKMGLCYSPPLRRSINSSYTISKSQSCMDLDWLELEQKPDVLEKEIDVFDDNSAKTLVKEAVVELTTLLDQLTTRTLSESVDINGNSSIVDEKASILNCNDDNSMKIALPDEIIGKVKAVETNSKVETVNVSKPIFSISRSKDDEIIFHFPPPPLGPPPTEENSVQECFEVLCKNGRMLVSSGSSEDDTSPSCSPARTSAGVQANSSEDFNFNNIPLNSTAAPEGPPTPLPRRAKQNFPDSSPDLKRSASYSMLAKIPLETPLYENLNIERCKTLPRQLTGDVCQDFETDQSLDSSVSFSSDTDGSSTFGNKLNHGILQKNSKSSSSSNSDYEVIYPVQSQGFSKAPNKDTGSDNFKSGEKNRTEDAAKQPKTAAAIISMVDALIQSSPKNIDTEKSLGVSLDLLNDESAVIPFVRHKSAHANISLADSKVSSSSLPLVKGNCCPRENIDTGSPLYSGSAEMLSKVVVQEEPKKYSLECENDLNSLEESYHTSVSSGQKKTDEFSIYGKVNKKSKVCTVAPLQLQVNSHDIGSKISDSFIDKNVGDKKRLIPSRKTERAPLPPSLKSVALSQSSETKQTNQSENTPKRLPSRKHEKAPEPPKLCTSASFKNISLTEHDSVQLDSKLLPKSLPPIQPRKQKLNALYENITEVQRALSKVDIPEPPETEKPPTGPHQTQNTGYALKHSNSDASVFLALREKKSRSLRPRRELHMVPKPVEAPAVHNKDVSSSTDSSGDSDSSLLQVSDAQVCSLSNVEPATILKVKSKKGVPVAPPRSKRRSTMEIHYTQKEGSKEIPNSPSRGSCGLSKSATSVEEEAPAIPTKTREAFEVPEEFMFKGNRMSAPAISLAVLKLPDEKKLPKLPPPRKPLQ